MRNTGKNAIALIIIVLIAVCLTGHAYALFSGGDGSIDNPYLVGTADELNNARYHLKAHFRQTADIDLTGYGEDKGWKPIGDYEAGFSGSFDGDHFRIFNLKIDAGDASLRSGLFGYVSSGELRNIVLSDVDIRGGNITGSLAGQVTDRSLVFNCSATGIVRGRDNVGGLTGINSHFSIIQKSYSTADVIASGSNAGGLAGSNRDATIRNSYSTGDVIAGASNAGGLTGDNNFHSLIENCYASGTVSGNSRVGGLAGSSFHNSIIKNSYSTGIVRGNRLTGGLTGESFDSRISNIYWDIVTSGQESSDGGEGKLTVEMLESPIMYDNWDFTGTWEMTDFTTYPYLQWQGEPGIHNYPPNGYHKIFADREFYWESFPVLWDRDVYGYQSAQSVLYPLTDGQDYIHVRNEDFDYMIWTNTWTGDVINFNSTRGYQISFGTEDEIELKIGCHHLNPQNIPFDTEVLIDNNREENWLGYFIPQIQCVHEAFGAGVMIDLQSIKGEEWSMWRIGPGQNDWMSNYLEPQVEYGKMYKVETRAYVDYDIGFPWNLPIGAEDSVDRPRAEWFTYDEKADYEAFFILDIEDDEDVLEVAVYAGEECVGASVFAGEYPLEILAYTDASHQGQAISFSLLRDGQRGMGEKIRVPEVKDLESGEFSPRILEPGRQKFSIVRLGAGEYETEEIIEPIMTLSQNYPNPVGFISGSRSNLTGIPFYVSEEREVTLTVYNIRGQRVKTLFKGSATAGKHSIGWNGLNEQNRPVGSGIYFYRLESGDQTLTRKMLLIR